MTAEERKAEAEWQIKQALKDIEAGGLPIAAARLERAAALVRLVAEKGSDE